MSKKKKFPVAPLLITVILIAVSATVLLTQANKDPNEPIVNDRQTLTDANDLNLLENSTVTFRNLIEQGDQALQNRDFGSALSQYLAAYQLEKTSLIPYNKIINVYLISENYDVALQNINLVSKLAPLNPDVLIAQTRYYLSKNDTLAAEQALNKLNPATEKINFYKIIYNIVIEHHDRAKELTNTLAEQVSDPELKTQIANIKKAYDLYGTFESGNEAYLNTLLGQVLVNIGEYKLARNLFYKAIEKSNDFRDAWIGIGYAFLQIKNYPQAEDALDRAKKADPYKPEIYFYQALVNEEMGNFKRALGLLTQAKNYEYSNIVAISEHLASNYYALGQYDHAIPHYEAVISAKKVPIKYFVAPIWIHLEQTKNLDKALLIAKKALQQYPNQAESYNYLGWVYLYRNELDLAKNNLNQAITNNPQLAAAYLNFGLLFKEQKKYDGALQYLQKAAQLAQLTKDTSILARANQETAIIQQMLAPTNN